jgi:hypothetical protein
MRLLTRNAVTETQIMFFDRTISMRVIRTTLLMTASLLLSAAPSMAQSSKTGLLEIEGPVEAASADSIKVLGVTVKIQPNTKVVSPTATITAGDLAAGPALPGRIDLGFINGYAIVTGTRDATGAYAQQIYVEPADHHLIGVVTKNEATGFEVEGTPVVLLPSTPAGKAYPETASVAGDVRLPGVAAKNASGLPISPASIAVGAEISVAGYYVLPKTVTEKGVVYAHTIVASSDDANQAPGVSILRAECRQRAANEIEFDVRGVAIPASGTVAVLNAATGAQYGVATVSPDVSDPGKGQYRYRAELKNVVQTCPEKVQARFTSGGSVYTATATVERR